jgi:hypothetical protein
MNWRAGRAVGWTVKRNRKTKKPPLENQRRLLKNDHRVEEKSVLGRPGSDLLFQALRLSTIGAEEFNGRVRYGNGFRPLARTTRSAKDGFASWLLFQCHPSKAWTFNGHGK